MHEMTGALKCSGTRSGGSLYSQAIAPMCVVMSRRGAIDAQRRETHTSTQFNHLDGKLAVFDNAVFIDTSPSSMPKYTATGF